MKGADQKKNVKETVHKDFFGSSPSHSEISAD